MKVLSIDGGGIRGLIPALVLAEIEARTGRRIAELVALAREVGFPSVGVAVHPEGHPTAPSRASDMA